jgi:hypothetical protein
VRHGGEVGEQGRKWGQRGRQEIRGGEGRDWQEEIVVGGYVGLWKGDKGGMHI